MLASFVSLLPFSIGKRADRAIEAHPHETVIVHHLVKLTKNLAPVTYATPPSLPSLSTRLSSFLDDAAMTNSSLSPSIKTTLVDGVIPFLSKSPAPTALPKELEGSWPNATIDAVNALPPKEWFPVLDLWRLALSLPSAPTAFVPPFTKLLPSLLPKLEEAEDTGKATSLTTIRLLSNALPFSLLDLSPALDSTTRIVIRSLLDEDKSVRSAGAGLAWSLVSRRWGTPEGERKEEWDVEIAAAVCEALERESESGEVGSFSFHFPFTALGDLGLTRKMRYSAPTYSYARFALVQVTESPRHYGTFERLGGGGDAED
jgi:hypothetical protein